MPVVTGGVVGGSVLRMDANELKRRLAVVRSKGLRRYPRELREEARRYAQLAHADGACMMAIGRALEVNDKSVAYWLRSSSKGKSAGKLARISVVQAPSGTARACMPLALEIGSGMRLVGLDVVSAAALLRLLS